MELLRYLAKDLVLGVQSSSASNVCFLSCIGHVETDTSLTLSFIQDKIHGIQSQHVLVDFDGELFSHLEECIPDQLRFRECVSGVCL